MKYYATDHLKERLLERNITQKDINECLDNYHSDYPCKDSKHCHYYVGDIRGQNLRVLVDNKKRTLITAYWLDE